jgi:hypothetical protein
MVIRARKGVPNLERQEAQITTGFSGFAECNTRQRVLGKYFVGKDVKEKHSAKCKSEKNGHSAKGSARQNVNRKKIQKIK